MGNKFISLCSHYASRAHTAYLQVLKFNYLQLGPCTHWGKNKYNPAFWISDLPGCSVCLNSECTWETKQYLSLYFTMEALSRRILFWKQNTDRSFTVPGLRTRVFSVSQSQEWRWWPNSSCSWEVDPQSCCQGCRVKLGREQKRGLTPLTPSPSGYLGVREGGLASQGTG